VSAEAIEKTELFTTETTELAEKHIWSCSVDSAGSVVKNSVLSIAAAASLE
jgi:hypothetical protein